MKTLTALTVLLLLTACDDNQPQERQALPLPPAAPVAQPAALPAPPAQPAPVAALPAPAAQSSSGGGIMEHMATAAAAGAAAGSAGAVAHNITNRVMDRMAVHKRARRIRKMQRRR